MLVHRFNDGDESAFVEIVARHRQRLYGVGYGMLRNHADAEEIAQDALLRAHRGLAQFRGDSSLATWLHRIAANLARNRYWHGFRRRQHATISLDCALYEGAPENVSDLVATSAAGPAQEAETAEFSALVDRCMPQLGEKPLEILTLLNTSGHSYQEIAELLGITLGTVKSRIARARKRLHRFLVEACVEFEEDSSLSDWFEPNRTSGRLR